MNLVYISGKIVGHIKFDFMINSIHNSIARFKLELNNKSIVEVITYDEMADYCYKNLQPQMQLIVEGRLNSKMDIEIKEMFQYKTNNSRKVSKTP